jgi:hypothetical protein
MHGKALGIARVLCQPVMMLYMHAATPRTFDTPAFKLQIDPPTGNRKIPHVQDLLVITSPAAVATVRTDRSFFRLLSWMTRAYRSPNTPLNREAAVNPGNENSEPIVLGFFMRLVYPKNRSLFIDQ